MEQTQENTKTLIKQAAIRQIEKYGIEKTSMRSIAKECGMTTGAIYYYYKNKQDLFDEIINDSIHFSHRIFKDYQANNIVGQPLLKNIENEVSLRLNHTQEEKLHILLLADAMNDTADAHEKCRQNLLSITSQTAKLFAPSFEISDSAVSEQLASIFVAALDGVAIQQMFQALPADNAAFIDTFIDFFKESIPAYIKKHNK